MAGAGAGMNVYRSGIALLAFVLIGLGLVLIGQGIAGGRPIGLLIGALFIAAGVGRLYLLRRR
ncbi:MAG: hypothetical protein ACXVZ4_00695 [Gaiellaceae bacterium]